MYRLIAPMVDFANSTLGLEAYFEFNQTSAHGTSQSVDIALLDGQGPRVMVEAKRVDRRIAAEQISKYLHQDVRGLVTNGIHWVICLNERSRAISMYEPVGAKIVTESFNEVVAFIRGEQVAKTGWTTGQKYIDPTVTPEKLQKRIRAHRTSNLVNIVTDTCSLRQEIAGLSRASAPDKDFLAALLGQFERQGGIPPHLRCEVHASRVVFFDNRSQCVFRRT